ncbi:MAG: FecR domain-containing protein [Paucibacter sp.]|nr:FecR domain-containing protein [Roseateles sp.]
MAALLTVTALLQAPAAQAAPTRPTATKVLPALPASTAPADWQYRIQPGDTLLTLTEAYLADGASWRALQRINQVADPLKLQPGAYLRMPIALLRSEAGVAAALFTQGEVSLRRTGQAAEPLRAGAELRAGDVVRTGPQSSLTLRFVDGSRMLLAPDSQVAIERLLVYGRSGLPLMQLRLQQGRTEHLVARRPQRPPIYEVRTPSLNLGVRGTEFRIQLADNGTGTHAQVLAGMVAADRLQVAAGYGVAATDAGQPAQLSLLPPAPDLQGLQPLIEKMPLRLTWSVAAAAQAYRAQVFPAGDPERLLLDGRFEQPLAQWPDLPDGAYTLRVRSIDDLGHEGHAAEANFTVKARPEPPFIKAPAADAVVYGKALTLAWTQPLGVQGFALQLAQAKEMTDELLLDRRDLTATEFTHPLAPGRYYWRLASIAAGADLGPWGELQSVELRAEPPSPQLAPPELGADTLQLRWPAAQGAASYQLQWARDAEFTQMLAEPGTDHPALTLPKPPPGRYFLRARSVDAGGYAGPYGTTQQVDIPATNWLLWLLPLGALLLVL